MNNVAELLGQEWAEVLSDEFEKEYMKKLSEFIKKERNEYTVYPIDTEGVFQVFRRLQPSQIKVLIIGQDPYPDGSYCGMAFSNQNKRSISKSLQNILVEVWNDIYDGLDRYKEFDPDLTRWQSQGVFLINRILTVRKNMPLSHRNKGWEQFTSTAISKLSLIKNNLVFLLWGASAQDLIPDIQNKENHLILTAPHPSPLSAHRGFFGCKHFSTTNDYLLKNKLDFIEW